MPRRLPVKPDKFIGNLFILLVFATLIYIYYVYIGIVWGPKLIGKFAHSGLDKGLIVLIWI